MTEDRGTARPARPGARGGRGSRAVLVITAVSAVMLALIHAADVLQGLLGFTYTAYDFVPVFAATFGMGASVSSEPPFNAVQTVVLVVLSALVLVGGSLAAGYRGIVVRVGGALAVLCVVLPLTLPIVAGALFNALSRTMELRTGMIVFSHGVSLSALCAGVLGGAALLWGLRSGAGPARRRFPVLAVVAGVLFLVEEFAALVHGMSAEHSWWAPSWLGIVGWSPVMAALTAVGLAAALVLGAVGAGGLLSAGGVLTRIGGGVLLLAVLVRVLTQVLAWGMLNWIALSIQSFSNLWVLTVIDALPGILVPVVASLGLLLGLIGMAIPPRAAPQDGRDEQSPGRR